MAVDLGPIHFRPMDKYYNRTDRSGRHLDTTSWLVVAGKLFTLGQRLENPYVFVPAVAKDVDVKAFQRETLIAAMIELERMAETGIR